MRPALSTNPLTSTTSFTLRPPKSVAFSTTMV
jgi:hypothetical protein